MFHLYSKLSSKLTYEIIWSKFRCGPYSRWEFSKISLVLNLLCKRTIELTFQYYGFQVRTYFPLAKVQAGLMEAYQVAATHCNTLQHTATHCNTLQYTVAHCSTLQSIAILAMHSNAHSRKQHSTVHCSAMQCTATHCNALQRTATHCNALQHTATHCRPGALRPIWWL